MMTVLFFTMLSWGQLVSVDLAKMTVPSGRANELAKIKQASQQAQWRQCLNQIDNAWVKSNDLHPWLLAEALFCARQGLSVDAKGFQAAAMKSLRNYHRDTGRWQQGPWAGLLSERWLELQSAVLENLKGKEFLTELDRALNIARHAKADVNDQAKWLLKAGEELVKLNQKAEALMFFEWSHELAGNAEVSTRIQQLRLALSPEPTTEKKLANPNGSPVAAIEQEWQVRLEQTQKSNDVLLFFTDAVAYLNRFPGGQQASELSRRLVDLYVEVQRRSEQGQSDARLVLERTLTTLEKLDGHRLADFARQLHRRSDFFGSLRLAERAISQLGAQHSQATLHYVAGRSAQMVGDNRKAQRFFEAYLDRYPAGEDAEEVSLRLAMVFLRQEQLPSASAVLERMLSRDLQKTRLPALYWLSRIKEKTAPADAKDLKAKIISEFPFTYFGLRLAAEQNQQKLTWPLASQDKEPRGTGQLKVQLLPSQRTNFERVRLLSRAGWFEEATLEWQSFLVPLAPELRAEIVRLLTQDQLFLPAIRLQNQLIEEFPRFHTQAFVGLGFPRPFAAEIEPAARQAGLSPRLVWALIRQESGFYPRARSSAMAMGLMQLIPPTAKEVAADLKMPWRGPEDSYDIQTNVKLGVRYLARMIDQFRGSVPLALAAYNAGPGRMEKFLNARPPVQKSMLAPGADPFDELWFDELPWSETSFYVKAILRNTLIYQMLDGGVGAELAPGFWTSLHTRPLGPERSPQGRQK